MHPDRRGILSAGVTAVGGIGLLAAAAGPRATAHAAAPARTGSDLGIEPNSEQDQTGRLQAAIDRAAPLGQPLILPAGRIRTSTLTLRSGTTIIGAAGRTRLELSSGGPLLVGRGASGVHLEALVLDGRMVARPGTGLGGTGLGGLVDLVDADGVVIRGVMVTRSAHAGITLTRGRGTVTDCTLTDLGTAAIHSLDARGLSIADTTIDRIGNNGILVWRSTAGEDGTRVAHNRIGQIGATAGGSGQNGNGINLYRAGSVLVSGNRITDCAYSAIRANGSSNVQMIANSCERIGEVALYAEFAFEGALIANNLVDRAATGISVTNFNEGGRLAVIQGNIVRRLVRREAEPEDKRGEGIAVEADSIVTGNVVEDAATCGLLIGWGRYMRDVIASHNLIRRSPIGIAMSADGAAGTAVVTGNIISGATRGGIRMMRGWTPTGVDLASAQQLDGRIRISGNVAT